MVKVAILHEGKKGKSLDYEILNLLIENLDLDKKRVEYYGFGPKSNFFDLDSAKYKDLKLQIEEQEIGKILFVVDADDIKNDAKHGGFDNTKKELLEVINHLNIKEISDIHITCVPKSQSGYMESLILSTIPDKEKKCIDSFLECSQFKSKENAKAILNQIYKTAYPNAPYDFKHENFNELKQKLQNLFKEKK